VTVEMFTLWSEGNKDELESCFWELAGLIFRQITESPAQINH